MKLAANCDLAGVPVDEHKLFVTGDPAYLTILIARYERVCEIREEQREKD